MARFSRWDGSQRLPPLEPEEVLRALADDLMAEGDLAQALRRLMERGWRSDEPSRADLPGLQDLLERLRDRQQELLESYRLGDVLADVREELEAVVDQERDSIVRRLEAQADRPTAEPGETRTPERDRLGETFRRLAERRLAVLDALPTDIGRRIRALSEDEFLDRSARARFEALIDRLRGQVLERYVRGLSDSIRRLAPEDLAANRAMVRDLNRLLQERLAGGDPDVAAFLAKHGHFFPGARTLDDIIDQLATRMAAMQSLLRSMTPEQRAELQSMVDALLRDDRLRWDLAQLAATLDQLLPGGLGERIPFSGDEPLGFADALDQLARLQAIEALERQLEGVGSPGDLEAVDRAAVRDLLGEEAVGELDALARLTARLEEAGYLERRGDRLELTPRGMRRIGQKVLDDLFARLRRDAFGGHPIDRAGRGGEWTEVSKPYEFGDPFHLDLNQTLFNALRRPKSRLELPSESLSKRFEGRSSARAQPTGRPRSGSVRLRAADFEVARTERLSRASTVLLVDMSRSMFLRGCFVAAKKVAIALDTLIRSEYPRDHLAIIGFAYYAREIRPEALAELSWHGYEYGTNLQHGLMLARRILSTHHDGNREIVVITDGEPTAHFEKGQVEFSYPPTRRTIQATLREVLRCTREGITINTFMLERSRPLAEFVAMMTRLNQGRAFFSEPENLGRYILVDFVQKRTKHVP